MLAFTTQYMYLPLIFTIHRKKIKEWNIIFVFTCWKKDFTYDISLFKFCSMLERTANWGRLFFMNTVLWYPKSIYKRFRYKIIPIYHYCDKFALTKLPSITHAYLRASARIYADHILCCPWLPIACSVISFHYYIIFYCFVMHAYCPSISGK